MSLARLALALAGVLLTLTLASACVRALQLLAAYNAAWP